MKTSDYIFKQGVYSLEKRRDLEFSGNVFFSCIGRNQEILVEFYLDSERENLKKNHSFIILLLYCKQSQV